MNRRVLFIFLTLILAVCCLTGCGSAEDAPAPERELLRLHQIDIGSADAYLLTVGDTVILVDCGTNITVPISDHANNPPLFSYLEASGIDHVDVHFVTHWHNDHCYNVDRLSELYGTDSTVVYGASAEILKALDPLPAGTYQQLKDGDRLTVGPLDILCVSPPFSEKLTGASNSQSLNFIVTYGNIRIMFGGDFMDWSLVRRWGDTLADVDILSFPHHGLSNPFAVTEQVYKLVNPHLVLVPGGERGVVRKFALHQAYAQTNPVILCSRDGNILVSTDGTDIWYAVQVEPGTFPLGEKLPPRENVR